MDLDLLTFLNYFSNIWWFTYQIGNHEVYTGDHVVSLCICLQYEKERIREEYPPLTPHVNKLVLMCQPSFSLFCSRKGRVFVNRYVTVVIR